MRCGATRCDASRRFPTAEREETLEADKPEEKPAAEAAPKKPAPKPAAQAGVAQPAPQQPAAETPTAEEPAAEKPAAEEPMEEAPAPAADVEEDPSKPQKAWGQCGGTAPSAEANLTWAGPTTCEEGATCVHLSKTFQQVRCSMAASAAAQAAAAARSSLTRATARASAVHPRAAVARLRLLRGVRAVRRR
jgi:outer membrane biosynthesis protein TonB